MAATYAFRAELWQYPGEASWHFLTLPPEAAEQIREESAGRRKGFGSIKVMAEASGLTWQTSIFPDAKSGSYLLPVKKAVRTAGGLMAGDEVDISLTIEDEDEAVRGAGSSGSRPGPDPSRYA